MVTSTPTHQLNNNNLDKIFNLIRTTTFPVENLPPNIRNVVIEIQENTNSAPEFIFSSLLGSMSLVSQGLANVQIPNGTSSPSPISCFLITLMESGGGKTYLAKLINKPIDEFEVKQSESFKQQQSKYKSDMRLWNITTKELEKALSKSIKNGLSDQTKDKLGITPDEGNIDFLKKEFAQHLEKEPCKPRNFKMLYNNTTPSALMNGLHDNFKSASLYSDEGASIFKGQALRELSLINDLWSGSSIPLARTSSEKFTLCDARLTLALMVQPNIFKEYLERHGDEARSIGLFARCLICSPNSSLGQRTINDTEKKYPFLSSFHTRITELLEQNLNSLKDPNFTRSTLEFADDAKKLWVDIFHTVESYIAPDKCLSDIKDYGAKFGENLARVAAIIHLFSDSSSKISINTTMYAFYICTWFMHEFNKLFSVPPTVPPEVSNAELIKKWLASQIHTLLYEVNNNLLCVHQNLQFMHNGRFAFYYPDQLDLIQSNLNFNVNFLEQNKNFLHKKNSFQSFINNLPEVIKTLSNVNKNIICINNKLYISTIDNYANENNNFFIVLNYLNCVSLNISYFNNFCLTLCLNQQTIIPPLINENTNLLSKKSILQNIDNVISIKDTDISKYISYKLRKKQILHPALGYMESEGYLKSTEIDGYNCVELTRFFMDKINEQQK